LFYFVCTQFPLIFVLNENFPLKFSEKKNEMKIFSQFSQNKEKTYSNVFVEQIFEMGFFLKNKIMFNKITLFGS
jgi:hypothetical protein